jgi:hypothetical protein
MARASVRDVVLVLAACAGLHALFVTVPSWLVREEPSWRVLPLTAPDCAALIRDAGRPPAGWFRGGTGANVPASPIR